MYNETFTQNTISNVCLNANPLIKSQLMSF
uniref:Uncharacterized protein n=1 Tax=Rhizophora mucronata TaxID=61149 RepID=A0A2P2N402_RHIMU